MNFWSCQGSLAFPAPISANVSVTRGWQQNSWSQSEYFKNGTGIFISEIMNFQRGVSDFSAPDVSRAGMSGRAWMIAGVCQQLWIMDTRLFPTLKRILRGGGIMPVPPCPPPRVNFSLTSLNTHSFCIMSMNNRPALAARLRGVVIPAQPTEAQNPIL